MIRSFIFGYMIAYFLGAFVSWDLNPASWILAARLWVSFMGLAFTAFIMIGIGEKE